MCAVFGVLGFSFKAILIKLAYRSYPVDAITLLTLRMLYSAPLFMLMAAWAQRGARAAPTSRADWLRLVWLGCIGYYLASLLDFMGLQYITASLERLVLFLYPTIVVLLSALMLKKPITRRAVVALVLSYAGIALVFWHDLRLTTDGGATLAGGGLVFASAILYALYLVQAGGVIARLGSSRFISWAMLASTVFIVIQFLLTRPLSALAVPGYIHALSVAMAIFSTVLPTWLIAESIRRMGANSASLVGSLGPVFTIGMGAMILGETVHAIQLAGAALVLGGVMLVTMKPRAAATADAPGLIRPTRAALLAIQNVATGVFRGDGATGARADFCACIPGAFDSPIGRHLRRRLYRRRIAWLGGANLGRLDTCGVKHLVRRRRFRRSARRIRRLAGNQRQHADRGDDRQRLERGGQAVLGIVIRGGSAHS